MGAICQLLSIYTGESGEMHTTYGAVLDGNCLTANWKRYCNTKLILFTILHFVQYVRNIM